MHKKRQNSIIGSRFPLYYNKTGGKQLVVSVGKAVDNDGNAVEVTQAPARTRGARTSYGTWNSVRVIPGYTADGHSAMLAANSYQLATWSLLVLNSQTGGEDIRLVTYYPKLAFDQLSITPPTGQDSIDGLKTALPKGRKIIDSPDYVCRHTKLAFQANVSKGSECEVGKWYRDKDFGYIYILPTINEWNSQDGYKKWLANEWSLPMCGETSVDHGVTDMSMPALEGPGMQKKCGQSSVHGVVTDVCESSKKPITPASRGIRNGWSVSVTSPFYTPN